MRATQAATAIEFAFVAAPFIGLMVAIFETAMVFFTQQVLQTATTQTARLIMTGQAQTQNITQAQFTQDVCNASTFLVCANLYTNVQTFTSFSTMTMLNPLSSGTVKTSSLNYSLGSIGSIMLVQVFYQMPVYTAPLGFSLSNMSGNNRLLVATAVFRNEPY